MRCMSINSYPSVDIGDLTGLFFRREYMYVIVISGGYLPVAMCSMDTLDHYV
jgi:hypothetical protein